MNNTTNAVLKEETETTNSSPLTKEQFKAAVISFKEFVKSKDNKPYYCKTYGTKYAGEVRFDHYVAYAIMRGKNPEITTHDAESESFKCVMLNLKRMAESTMARERMEDSISKAFGLSSVEFQKVLVEGFAKL
ncbi:hypothetical protein VCHA53O466_40478 [Vibrio chagasii]|nr:hypothetical protein VCHA53O466_40478 [Vibrio chagasii]